MPLDISNAHGLILSRVIPNGHWFFHDSPVRVTSCCTQAEQCEPGDLFVVLDEHQMESQETIDLAITRGAVAILCERPLPNAIPQYVVDDCRVALGQVAHALAGKPCSTMRTLGVAGTYGKSMTSRLLTAVFKAADQSTDFLDTKLLTDQGAMRLARWLGEARTTGHQNAVLECATESLARQHLSGTELDTVVLTNIQRGKAGDRSSLHNYQRATLSILDHRKSDGFVVLNADDRVCQSALPSLDAPTLTIGLKEQADVTASVIERHASEQTFLLHAGDESMAIRTRIIGDGHIYNCMTTAAIGLVLGIDATDVIRGIESVETMEGRMQRVECGQPFSVFVENSATPAALSYTLSTLRSLCPGQLHCLLGVDRQTEDAELARVGTTLERFADRSVVTGARLDQKMSLRTGHDILDGFTRPAQANVMPDRAKAICWVLSQAEPGDMVVLAGGQPSMGPDEVLLADDDVAEYWLRHVHDPTSCPWQPA